MATSLVRRAAELSAGALVVAASAIAPATAYAAPSSPVVTISDIAISEGDSGTTNAVFTVKLSKAGGKINTIEYATADGTATAGLDYQAKSGTVTFNKRETSKTIQVPIIGDTIDEPDETFTVVLSQASKDLVIGDGTGQATITDDDTAPPTPTQADLAIHLTDSPDPVGLGSELTYTAQVVNHGPDTAVDVVVVDQLKPYVTFVSAGPGCAYAGGKVTCTTASLAPGAAYEPQITVVVNTTGAISNTASVSSGTQDPDSSNNSDTEASQVNPTADLSVSLSHSPEPVPFGESVTFTLGLHNDGPSPAQNAVAHLQLPTGIEFSSADAGCSYDAPNRTVNCSAGNLASGGSASYAIVATAAPGTRTVTATATTSTPDPDASNNQATDVVNATGPQADVALTTTSAPESVLTGELVTYTWTVTNNGPQTAEDITLHAVLPAGAQFSSLSGEMGCVYVFSTRDLTCTAASLASGASLNTQMQFTYNEPGTKTFDSTVSAATADPVAGNNQTTTVTTVNAPQADLALTANGTPGTVLTGEVVTYTWTITNNGPQAAQNVVLAATLPEGAEFSSFGGGDMGCTYVFASRELTCNASTLASGASLNAVFNATYSTAGTKTFTSTVSSATSDPVAGNNGTSTTTTVNAPVADLGLFATGTPESVTTGQVVTYTWTITNDGPQAAQNVVLHATLPEGAQFSSFGGGDMGCTYVFASRELDCTLATLASGGSATATVSFTYSTGGTKTFTSTVSASTNDFTPENNTRTLTTNVTFIP